MTTGSSDLDALLTGTAPDVTEPEPTGEVETPAVEAAVTPPVIEKPAEDKLPTGHVPLQALTEERRKRQELESQLAEFRAKSEPKVNLFEDPEKWEKELDERVERRLSAVRQESEERFLTLVGNAARARHADFNEVAKVFADAANVTPGLADEARNASDPAEFIYTAGLNLKRFQEAGSIDKLIEQAEARGEERARLALLNKSTPKIPESLTEIAGGTGDTTPKAFAPKPLSELLAKY